MQTVTGAAILDYEAFFVGGLEERPGQIVGDYTLLHHVAPLTRRVPDEIGGEYVPK
jgi:hypothetical protein